MLVLIVLIGICLVGDAYAETAIYEMKAYTMTHIHNMNMEVMSNEHTIRSMVAMHCSRMRMSVDSAIHQTRAVLDCFKFRLLSIGK